MVTAMAAILVIGGLVLLLDIGGAAKFAIRHLTSKNLGALAPGYAASRSGFRVYAVLIASIGIAALGLVLAWQLALAGAAIFVVASVVAIIGEVQTYRSLPGRQGDGQAD